MERLADKPACDICRAIHGDKEPDCAACMPVLMAQNEEALHLWHLVKTQVVSVGMGNAVDLNHLAVWEAMDRYQVHDPIGCFEKLTALFRHLAQKNAEAQD